MSNRKDTFRNQNSSNRQARLPRQRLAAIAGATSLLMFTTGCGLSNAEISQYKEEIQASGVTHKILSEHFNKLIELNKKALSGEYLGFSGFAESEHTSRKMIAITSYSACLDRYMKAKEKFAIAKTNCTAESGISNFN